MVTMAMQFAGAILSDPLLLYPGVADKRNLQPFYDIVSDYIRREGSYCFVMFSLNHVRPFAAGDVRIGDLGRYVRVEAVRLRFRPRSRRKAP